jgi:MFS family permease
VGALVSLAATAANKPQAASNSFAALTLFFVVQFTVPLQPLSSPTTCTVTLLPKASDVVVKNSIANRRMLEECRQVELFPCSSMGSLENDVLPDSRLMMMIAWHLPVRKKLHTTMLFALSNALAAAAPNIGVMALARFIPALMLPVFWSLASETAVQITGPERAGKAISMISFSVVTATIFGIPKGTLISDKFGWRSAFAVLSALALAKAFLLLGFLPKIHGNKERIFVWRQLGILGDPRILGHVLLSLLVFAGMFTAYTYLTDML